MGNRDKRGQEMESGPWSKRGMKETAQESDGSCPPFLFPSIPPPLSSLSQDRGQRSEGFTGLHTHTHTHTHTLTHTHTHTHTVSQSLPTQQCQATVPAMANEIAT